MMRSLYSGVSGLQNHQIRMDVIGNNISNVNTTGFKKGRVNFQDLISQNMSGAARPTEELGGVNPKQIGLGMTVAAIDTIHTQGSLQSTGVVSDISIQGNGFYVLRSGDTQLYTRAGAFSLDSEGYLVNPANGMRVQGWLPEVLADGQIGAIRTSSDVEDLIIPVGSKDPAKATALVELACNLDKRTPIIPEGATPATIAEGTWSLNKTLYDPFGNAHIMRMNFTRTPGINNSWDVVVQVDPDRPADADVPSNVTLGFDPATAAGNANGEGEFTITFDNLGALATVVDAQGNIVDAGRLQIPVTFDIENDAVGEIQTQEFLLDLGEVGSYTNSTTQFAETSSTKAYRQDGYTMGYLETFNIDQKGVIRGVYSNGTERDLGQVALASFTNPGGLTKTGETAFMRSINSGDALIGPSGVAGKGKIISGTLEMSNVDLAEQFTDMIVTQRGFQSNSKTIQTSDQMLQELLTLKR
ncbi:MAG: flagellar hook protein FlgE [Spirochaeta sp. LUC14_002_19_P3]|nr:MAG: flagellar hook protein FlgE [Spirochaeta sp. LUC14_002_19_P3]